MCFVFYFIEWVVISCAFTSYLTDQANSVMCHDSQRSPLYKTKMVKEGDDSVIKIDDNNTISFVVDKKDEL